MEVAERRPRLPRRGAKERRVENELDRCQKRPRGGELEPANRDTEAEPEPWHSPQPGQDSVAVSHAGVLRDGGYGRYTCTALPPGSTVHLHANSKRLMAHDFLRPGASRRAICCHVPSPGVSWSPPSRVARASDSLSSCVHSLWDYLFHVRAPGRFRRDLDR